VHIPPWLLKKTKMGFNKYNFIGDLNETIREQSDDGSIEGPDDIDELVCQEIDRECIYYVHCVEIIKELQLWSWEDNEKSVQAVAFNGLLDYAREELDIFISFDELKKRNDN